MLHHILPRSQALTQLFMTCSTVKHLTVLQATGGCTKLQQEICASSCECWEI